MSQRGGQICSNALNGYWKQHRRCFFLLFACCVHRRSRSYANASGNKNETKNTTQNMHASTPLAVFQLFSPLFYLFISMHHASCKPASLCSPATLAPARLFLISQSHMYTHRHTTTHTQMPERKPSQLEKCLSPDERLHTRCLHAEPLMTPFRNGARR